MQCFNIWSLIISHDHGQSIICLVVVTFLVEAWATYVNVKHGMMTFSSSSSMNMELTMIALDFYIFHSGRGSLHSSNKRFLLPQCTHPPPSPYASEGAIVLSNALISFNGHIPITLNRFLIFLLEASAFFNPLATKFARSSFFMFKPLCVNLKKLHHAWIATLKLLKQDKLRVARHVSVWRQYINM